MKKKIAILGSTGSIGKSTASIVLQNKKDFDVILLSTNKNLKELSKQCKNLKPKFLIINDYKSYLKFRKINQKKNFKIFNNYDSIKKIFQKKIDYAMSAISGFDGLKPTLDIIPFTKVIAIANKESIICGWNLIQSKIRKSKTHFIPVDSEHFSIWSLIKNVNEEIENIYITASGGPFLNMNKKDLKKIKPKDAIKHPNWSMGKKISIDSATLMNKAFEIIEAHHLFDLKINQIKVIVHPESIIHSMVNFEDIPTLPRWIKRQVDSGEDQQALIIAEYLNREESSPWFQKIAMANQTSSLDKSTIRQKSFIQSIKKYILMEA